MVQAQVRSWRSTIDCWPGPVGDVIWSNGAPSSWIKMTSSNNHVENIIQAYHASHMGVCHSIVVPPKPRVSNRKRIIFLWVIGNPILAQTYIMLYDVYHAVYFMRSTYKYFRPRTMLGLRDGNKHCRWCCGELIRIWAMKHAHKLGYVWAFLIWKTTGSVHLDFWLEP